MKPNSSSPSLHVQGVLLDIDGTLLNSNTAHAQAWAQALTEAGMPTSAEQVAPLIGMGSDRLLPRLTGIEKESKRGKQISDRRTEIFLTQYVPALAPQPGARALLERMHADGLRLVAATSASDQEVQSLLRAAGIEDLLTSKTTADDAESSKPAPDIVQAAIDRIGIAPQKLLMLGDTPYDISAAQKANVAVIALRCGGWNDSGLKGACAIYDSPEDLLAQYESSPFFTL